MTSVKRLGLVVQQFLFHILTVKVCLYITSFLRHSDISGPQSSGLSRSVSTTTTLLHSLQAAFTDPLWFHFYIDVFLIVDLRKSKTEAGSGAYDCYCIIASSHSDHHHNSYLCYVCCTALDLFYPSLVSFCLVFLCIRFFWTLLTDTKAFHWGNETTMMKQLCTQYARDDKMSHRSTSVALTVQPLCCNTSKQSTSCNSSVRERTEIFTGWKQRLCCCHSFHVKRGCPSIQNNVTLRGAIFTTVFSTHKLAAVCVLFSIVTNETIW